MIFTEYQASYFPHSSPAIALSVLSKQSHIRNFPSLTAVSHKFPSLEAVSYQNKRTQYRHPCLEWNTSPRSQRSSEDSSFLRPRGHCVRLLSGELLIYTVLSCYSKDCTGRTCQPSTVFSGKKKTAAES
jgi:hypothetical protein